MANSLEKNFREKVLPTFLDKVESSMVTCKSVDRQIVGDGKWEPSSGDSIAVKRPLRFTPIETSDGDLSSSTESDINVGNAFANVQNYITVWTSWTNLEAALETGGGLMDQVLSQPAMEMVTRLETNYNRFIINNAAHCLGAAGTQVSTWEHVSKVGDFAKEFGFPNDGNIMVQLNHFAKSKLAGVQSGLLNDNLTRSAWEQAQLTNAVGGVNHFSSNALVSQTAGAYGAGTLTLNATPTQTYDSAKNSYQTTLVIAGLPVSTTGALKAGDVLQVVDNSRFYLQQQTKEAMLGEGQKGVKYTAVVTADANSDGSGVATVVVSGPAIVDASAGLNGAYDTISSALASGDEVAVISASAAGATQKPNLFYHKNAFGLSFVNLPRLEGGVVSASASTKSGMFSARISKYADGTANKQRIRFDILPAFACYNPLFAGRFFGGTTPGQ